MTQIKLAAKIGVKKTQIYNYEYDIDFPPLETLHKIAQALNIDVNYLMDDYYRFISSDYPSFFKELKKSNNWTYKNIYDHLGVYSALYCRWTNGFPISRESFNNIKPKIARYL